MILFAPVIVKYMEKTLHTSLKWTSFSRPLALRYISKSQCIELCPCFDTNLKFKFIRRPAAGPVYFSLNRGLACAPWRTSLTDVLLQSCKVSCLFSLHRLFSPFHFYRLELNGEPLNCPVDRNTLIRDKVGDLLHCRPVVSPCSIEADQERLLSLLSLFKD